MKVKQTPVCRTTLNLSLKLGIQGGRKRGHQKADSSDFHDVLFDELEKHGLSAHWSLVNSALAKFITAERL